MVLAVVVKGFGVDIGWHLELQIGAATCAANIVNIARVLRAATVGTVGLQRSRMGGLYWTYRFAENDKSCPLPA